MKRFILSAPPDPEGTIHLYEKDYHYLVRVRRLKAGSCFDAVHPDGTETRVRVLSTADKTLTGECLDPSEYTPLKQASLEQVPLKQAPMKQCPSPLPPVALFQGLPKGPKMDLIVRQAAEAGVSVIAPFESEYSTVRLKTDRSQTNKGSDERLKRWERIVREARQQSGSAVETVVMPPSGLDALLAWWESLKKQYARPLGILLHQEPLGTPAGRSTVKGGSPLAKGSFHNYLCNSPDFIALAVGPEGGFSPGELPLFLAAGFRPLVTGNTILRTETAALYGTAVIRTLLLESESWSPKG